MTVQKPIYINGTDYTALFPAAGYEVNYIKETGANAGLMINGAYNEDTLALKAVVSSPLMPVDEDQQAAFLQDVMSSDYASVYYFEPSRKNFRTAVMRWELGKTKYRGLGADGKLYWTGMAVTFTDRYDMEA